MRSSTQRFFGQWVLATFGGWLLGVVVALLLAAIADRLGVGDQSSIGIGMGWSVGYAQWRIARNWIGATSQWMWASVSGMGTAFVLSDLVGTRWSGAPFLLHLNVRQSEIFRVIIFVALGSLLVGLWQWRTLQSSSVRAHWWIAASIAGWISSALLPILMVSPGHQRSSMKLWLNFGGITLGGVVLGVITGGALVWLLRSSKSAA